jgi:hypothetical protein
MFCHAVTQEHMARCSSAGDSGRELSRMAGAWRYQAFREVDFIYDLADEYLCLGKRQCSNHFEVCQGCHSFVVIYTQLQSLFLVPDLPESKPPAVQLQK